MLSAICKWIVHAPKKPYKREHIIKSCLEAEEDVNQTQENIPAYQDKQKIDYLTPHEILKHLGFDIPEEGVLVNPADRTLNCGALSLLGATLNVKGIPDDDLLKLREDMLSNAIELEVDLYGERKTKITNGDADSLLKLRAYIRALLTASYKYKIPL